MDGGPPWAQASTWAIANHSGKTSEKSQGARKAPLRKYATEEERLEAKRSQRRINDRKYYHQNPEAKIEKVKKYQAENKEKIKAKQRETYEQKKFKRF